MKLISIIIVNWNGLKWLSDCFRTIYAQDYKDFEVIFVDNASKDKSVAWVKENYPKTKIIINKENLGFADANNIGYKKAKGKYILFLNNDTKVTKTFLTELVNVLEKDNTIGGVQSKILLMDHPDIHDSVGAFLTPTGFLYHYGFGRKNIAKYNKEIELYTAKGACMMFRKDVLDAVAICGDIFDSDYFAYFEESDLCHRVWLAGYRIVYAYKSVIYHKMGATSSKLKSSFVHYHSFKNRIRTIIKNSSGGTLACMLPIHLASCLVLSFYFLVSGQTNGTGAIIRAVFWNLKNLGETLTLRSMVQKARRTSDKEIFSITLKNPSLFFYIHHLSLVKQNLSQSQN